MISRNIPLFALILLLLAAPLYAQSDSRVGTTAANFLEMGFGGAGNAMGDAYVSMGRDLSSVYWNPAGLGYMERNQVILNYQPWILDINTSAVSAAFANDRLGAIALTLYQTSYGEEKVTNTDMQTGTGETFDGQDIAVSATYGRKLAQWFSFGASAKYVTSRIWHERAGAVALDLGAIVNTPFFAWSDKPGDGLNIGMSISNYGTKMSYNGIDLKETVDINPDENGNYAYIPTRFETEGWELPLVARIGASINPLISGGHRLTVAVDFLHANNNSESMNVGAQYSLAIPAVGEFYLRGGYKGAFMTDSHYGLTAGGGMRLDYLRNQSLMIDYAFRNVDLLGGMHTYTLSFLF
ncbi:MAG TPA: PorV/PorQ family protein [bacterium]|mgnify:FL=1|nr:PorV/PorQ family protein [bacterium]HQI48435.1 PorV/PorQ family protein [bacterium]HQJ65897.1 PorV/PorQ family protein [bacterium]